MIFFAGKQLKKYEYVFEHPHRRTGGTENHFGAQKNDLSALIGCQVVSLRRSVFQSTQLSGLLAGARPSAAAFLLAARFAGAVTAAGTATFFLLRVSIVNKKIGRASCRERV